MDTSVSATEPHTPARDDEELLAPGRITLSPVGDCGSGAAARTEPARCGSWTSPISPRSVGVAVSAAHAPPALVAPHRDAFISDDGIETTVALAEHRGESTLNDVDLGEDGQLEPVA
jgi:hypothetical protein